MPKNLKDIQEWSPADTKIAALMWKEGKSAREIGRCLSRTRNSIIGKIHRIGLSRHDQTKMIYSLAGKIGREKQVKIVAAAAPVKNKNLPRPTTISLGHLDIARPWEMRGMRECAFPLTKPDGVYSCCIPTDDVYCEGHQKIMYFPRRAV
jgi:GcrA cell cycle regulator